jgi:peroxiredoxin Q/BCP
MLETGMDAPLFELPDADMEPFTLASLRDRKSVVLYFYPKDGTPGCTMEANEFSDLADEFGRHDAQLIGISRDDCISHAEFRDKYGLSVLLLADPEGRVCKKYGVLHDKVVDGHHRNVIHRSTFVIDKKGKLRHVMYNVHAHGHAKEVLNLIKEMK